PNQVDVMLARCFTELDDKAQQLETYKRLARHNPNSVTAKLELARAAARAGDLKTALTLYDEVLRLDGVPQGTWAEMIRLQIVYARQKGGAEHWQGIDAALDEADKISHTDKAEIAILRAESLFAQEKPQEARKALETARDAHPDRVELWTALAAF